MLMAVDDMGYNDDGDIVYNSDDQMAYVADHDCPCHCGDDPETFDVTLSDVAFKAMPCVWRSILGGNYFEWFREPTWTGGTYTGLPLKPPGLFTPCQWEKDFEVGASTHGALELFSDVDCTDFLYRLYAYRLRIHVRIQEPGPNYHHEIRAFVDYHTISGPAHSLRTIPYTYDADHEDKPDCAEVFGGADTGIGPVFWQHTTIGSATPNFA